MKRNAEPGVGQRATQQRTEAGIERACQLLGKGAGMAASAHRDDYQPEALTSKLRRVQPFGTSLLPVRDGMAHALLRAGE